MPSFRAVPGVRIGPSTETRELTFMIPNTLSNASAALWLTGTDIIIDEVVFGGINAPTSTANLRLFYLDQIDRASGGSGPVAPGSVSANRFITNDFATGSGTGNRVNSGATLATFTVATTGDNSGVAPMNNVILKGSIICVSASASLSGVVNNLFVTIRFRPIEAARLASARTSPATSDYQALGG